MNQQLQIINHNGQLLADSREVATMIEVRHSNLIRSITGYVAILENSKLSSQDFFIPSTYKVDGNNKVYDSFLLTRKGCDMVANKMTGEKGVLFTAAYVTKFEEMEQQLNPFNNLSPELKSIFIVDNKVQKLESKIAEVETKVDTQITLDSGRQYRLQKAIKVKVCSIEPNKDERGELFRQIHREIKDRWQVSSYKDVLKTELQEVLNYIAAWKPVKKGA
ncbi:Rha family phage regulatory protein [Paenibacillus turicensis]|uniref:Rha family phage regulatory protein n=1 Tax=Paenibacillus turicensis TaxID=160487 RepID=A0ABS4FSY1_9BACL|nr:Rha family transcriptional regulator [Paenibacillus turicensis]MBP1905681.1 Rha family phage regulatory protein [Paenibacillus turicensis]